MGGTTLSLRAEDVAERYERFVQEYFCHWDAERAYLAVGYNGKEGHTRDAAIGNLLRRVDVQARMQAHFVRLRESVALDQQSHAEEVCRLAYSDLRQLAEWGPSGVKLKPSAEIPLDAARAVQRVTSKTKTRMVRTPDGEEIPETEVDVDIQLHSKTAALDLLHRMYDKSQALRLELEAKLRAVAGVAVRYVPESVRAQYLAEVRLALGDIADKGEGLPLPQESTGELATEPNSHAVPEPPQS